ncbi:MAG: hypothetical protein J6S14_14700 [Clostridia bacterium]|nr:hypothetical protein [Clostridia bacterium]MBO7659885.1 hypothetical protein [Clostridia bacterium]
MPNTLKLERNKREVLEVEIEGEIYKIPLGTELKRKELAGMKKEENVMKFFEKYLGKELMDDLTVGELKQIINAWSEATQKASGVSLGES